MLKDRTETDAPWQCIVRYAPGAWNCNSANGNKPCLILGETQWDSMGTLWGETFPLDFLICRQYE